MSEALPPTLTIADLAAGDKLVVICHHQSIVATLKVKNVAVSKLNVHAEHLDGHEEGVQLFSVNGLLGTPWKPRIMLKKEVAERQLPHIGRADDRNGCGCTLTKTVRRAGTAQPGRSSTGSASRARAGGWEPTPAKQ